MPDKKPISYKKAIRQPPKEPYGSLFGMSIYDDTPVKWDPSIEAAQVIKLKTVGDIKVIIPPKLPAGYVMEWHPSWDGILPRLYEKDKTYPPLYIHHLNLDLRYLSKLRIHFNLEDFDVFIGPDNYQGYAEWAEAHSDAWYDLKERVFGLFYKATGFPKCNSEIMLPDEPAPSLREALVKMMELIDND